MWSLGYWAQKSSPFLESNVMKAQAKYLRKKFDSGSLYLGSDREPEGEKSLWD